jgi:hypothetical protein
VPYTATAVANTAGRLITARVVTGTPARGTETVGLRVAVKAVKRHKKTVVSLHGPHGSLPCRVRAACESLTSSTARLRNRITVPYGAVFPCFTVTVASPPGRTPSNVRKGPVRWVSLSK